jgi:cell division protein FtsZ
MSSPLLEASIDGARGVLLMVAGGRDLNLFEASDAADLIAECAHPDANIIFGAVIDDTLGDEVKVTVIAAGFDVDRRVEQRGPILRSADAPPAATPLSIAPPIVEDEDDVIRSASTVVIDDDDEFDDDLDVPPFLR